MLQKIIVCLIAGAGAGFGTGLAGMSAAAVIAPMLVTFLQVKPYEAVGIALASDVLASAASAHTYKKNKNIDVKNGLVMLVSVLIFTLVGIGNILDVYVLGGTGVLRTAVIFFYLSNEGVSLLENAAHLGLPIPEKLKEVLEQLHDRATDEKGGEE